MLDLRTLLILIPALPLAASLLTAVLGPRVLRARSHWPAVLAIAGSLAASLLLVFEVHRLAAPSTSPGGFEQVYPLWTWANISPLPPGEGQGVRANQSGQSIVTPPHPGPLPEGEGGAALHIDLTLRADPLTAIMLAMVTFVSLLVAVYSIGYMHDERGYWWFFTYIPLFVFAMTMLVSVSNFAMLYVFWEAVGLCSYLLIGFWYEKPEAAAAGKKAFLVNRVGDFGFALGVFLLWMTYGTLDFHDTHVGSSLHPGVLGQHMLGHPELYKTGAVATAICLLLLLGACGKSAQFPLHVWLPDAMEGPTPVSALIHAATMVTAGVYMVARCTPLFAASPDAQHVVAAIGAFTALLAALIAITQTDLKRILAYSTISQLGYMFLGLGMGTLLGVGAGMFHLFTHAFFKALLFLGAGSVMHAMGGVIDLRRFGGLRRRMPTTHWTFLFGCLALAGVFPFAGFWSKDMVLEAVHERAFAPGGHFFLVLYVAALFTALLTAFYTFRAFFLAFYGEERLPDEAGHHAHESPRSMTGPLAILAFAALGVGACFALSDAFVPFLARTPSLAGLRHAEAPESGIHIVAVTSTVTALFGIALAALLYLGRPAIARGLTGLMRGLGLYGLSYGKFFFDPLYDAIVVRPLRAAAAACYWIDRNIVDRLVNLIGLVPTMFGGLLRPLQNGLVQVYALAMVLGLLVLIGALLR